jgi:hypothetical protein
VSDDVKLKNHHQVKIDIADAENELGVHISIVGEMRLLDLLAVSYMMLSAAVGAGEARLGGALEAVRGAVESVQRTLNDEYPGTTIEKVLN